MINLKALVVEGNTYPYKETLKNKNFRWLSGDKIWVNLHIDQMDVPELDNVNIYLVDADPFKNTSVDPFNYNKYIRQATSDWKSKIIETYSNIAKKKEVKESEFKPGDLIKIANWQAKSIQKKLKLPFFWNTLEITEVLEEKPKAFQCKVKFVNCITSTCRMCGRDLTNEASKVSGIGPHCAKKVGVKQMTPANAPAVLELIEKIAKNMNEVGPVWISKKSIDTEEYLERIFFGDSGE